MKSAKTYYGYEKEDPLARKRSKILLEFFKNSDKQKKILDIGSGYGEILSVLKNKGFKRLSGMDFNKKCILECNKKGIVVTEGNIEKLDNSFFKRQKVDLVILSEVLEHLFDPDKAFFNIQKILIKNGTLVLSVPNDLNIACRLRYLFGKGVATPSASGGHIRFFQKKTIIDFLTNRGFKIDKFEARFYGNNFFSNWILFNFLSKRFPNLFGRIFVIRARLI